MAELTGFLGSPRLQPGHAWEGRSDGSRAHLCCVHCREKTLYKTMLLNLEWVSSPGDLWQCLEALLGVTCHGALLVSSD